MRNINLSDKNVFDERSAEFSSERLAKRLHDKYTPKPFEKRFNGVYWVSVVFSYICNAYSIAAASTFLFVQMTLLFTSVPYSFYIALAVTAVLLVSIEVLQRILSPMVFKNLYQYGYKNSALGLIIAIAVLSAISLTLSYKGGYDVTDKLTAVPVYVSPELANIQSKQDYHETLIREAQKDAESFKRSNSYKGRLDFARGQQYAAMLRSVDEHRKHMKTDLQTLQADNKTTIQTAKADYKALLAAREHKVSSRGGGMAKGAVIAQLMFFLCIWFMEHHDYSIVKQYAVMDVAEPKQVQVVGFKQSTQIAAQTPKPPVKQRHTMQTKTVTHNGKKYDKSGVQNFCNIYKNRVSDYEKAGKGHLVESNMQKLVYWNQLLKELT